MNKRACTSPYKERCLEIKFCFRINFKKKNKPEVPRPAQEVPLNRLSPGTWYDDALKLLVGLSVANFFNNFIGSMYLSLGVELVFIMVFILLKYSVLTTNKF